MLAKPPQALARGSATEPGEVCIGGRLAVFRSATGAPFYLDSRRAYGRQNPSESALIVYLVPSPYADAVLAHQAADEACLEATRSGDPRRIAEAVAVFIATEQRRRELSAPRAA